MPKNTNSAKKIEIIKLIDEHCLLLNDCKTLLWARTQKNCDVPKDCGGGNYLIPLGVFAVLNFLSKLYYLLSKNGEVWNEDEVKKIRDIIKSNPELHGAVSPTVGSPKVSEVDCFLKLVQDIGFPIFIDQKSKSPEEVKKLWKNFRVKLNHIAIPVGAAITFTSPSNYEEFIDLFESHTQPAAFSDKDRQGIFVDSLARDVQTKWVGKVKQFVEYSEITTERLEFIIKWVKDQKESK